VRPTVSGFYLSRWASAAFAALLLPFMLWLSTDFGVTFDEPPRQDHGERIFDFYHGEATRAAFENDASRLYGGLFDILAVVLQRVLPLDPFVVRHGLNAMFGWLGVVFCGALASRIAGPGVGLLSMVLLVLLPGYLGHAMNNPKDIPFAALGTSALFVMAGIPARYPFLTWPRIAGLALTIGLCLSVRPVGVLFLVYAGGVLAVQVLRSRDFDWRRLVMTAALFAVVTLLALTVPLPFWPWLQTRPYAGVVEALAGLSNFEWRGAVLFNGLDLSGKTLPWTYVPVWLLYTTPLVTLAGLMLSLGRIRPHSPLGLAPLGLWATVLFPIVYVVAKHSLLYNGIRFFLFIQPPLVILAALGWWSVRRARHWAVVATAMVVLAVGLMEPAFFCLRNHPNEVVYFNALAGGPRGALGRFDLDYWGNCVYQAQVQAARLAREARMRVVVSGQPWPLIQLNAPRLPDTDFVRLKEDRHHLEIALVQGQRRDVIAIASRNDVLARVTTADGAVLCTLFPGPAWAELEGRLRIARAGGASSLTGPPSAPQRQ
jgi:hypothetical protein